MYPNGLSAGDRFRCSNDGVSPHLSGRQNERTAPATPMISLVFLLSVPFFATLRRRKRPLETGRSDRFRAFDPSFSFRGLSAPPHLAENRRIRYHLSEYQIVGFRAFGGKPDGEENPATHPLPLCRNYILLHSCRLRSYSADCTLIFRLHCDIIRFTKRKGCVTA